MKTINTLTALILVFSFSIANARAKIEALTLKDVSVRTLDYVLNNQKSEDQGDIYIKGEWPTQIESTLIPVLAGVGRLFGKDEEATAFTTAAVVNNLSRLYLNNNELQNEHPFNKIPEAIQNAVNTYDRYREGETYNFYPARISNGVKVRRPIDMTLGKMWHGFTNIPNDSDTTSAVLTSLFYNSQINNNSFQISQESINIISKFVDNNRNPMFYNRSEGHKHTGAFMTWLMDEKDPSMPRQYFSKSEKGARIPFNKNDVDCIVNANILALLSMTKNTEVPGQKEACSMLNSIIQKDQHAKCGIYYPNTLNLSYALSVASKSGLQCITEDSNNKMIKKILSIQNEEGAWTNVDNIWEDPIITTSFALYSLLNLPHENNSALNRQIHSALIYGTRYLLQNVKQENQFLYWYPDNFFTATAIARSLIMWSSKAYTNSIISAVMLEMHKMYPEYNAGNYLTLNFGAK